MINMKTRMIKTSILTTTFCLLLAISNKSIAYYESVDPYFDADRVVDAIPRAEPKSRYGNPEQYTVFGKKYHVLNSAANYSKEGVASWYGPGFHHRKTSSGEEYDMYQMTAANKELPLPTYARVTNLENGKSVTVKINDRGPFKKDRIIDLSYAAAKKLDMDQKGTARVRVTAIDPNTETACDTAYQPQSAQIMPTISADPYETTSIELTRYVED